MFNLPADYSCIVWNASILDNLLQVRELIPDVPDLVQLLLVLHHQDAALAVLKNVFASICSICRINSCGKAPGKNCAKVGDCPLWRVETQNTDTVKPFQPNINEGLCYSAHILIVC